MTIGAKVGKGRTAQVFEWKDNKVVKLYREGFPLDVIEREANIARVAHKAGVETPMVGNIINVDKRKGLVFERVEGTLLLEDLMSKPWQVHSFARAMAALHVTVHQITVTGIPPQTEKFRNLIQQHFDGTERKRLLKYLDTLPEGDALCHNDFHPENIMLTDDGLIVIDWTNGTQGNPLADVARTSLMLTSGQTDTSISMRLLIQMFRGRLHKAYLNHYCFLTGVAPHEIDVWTPIVAAIRLVENIPGEETYLKTLIASVVNP